jgi:hypothetical protein
MKFLLDFRFWINHNTSLASSALARRLFYKVSRESVDGVLTNQLFQEENADRKRRAEAITTRKLLLPCTGHMIKTAAEKTNPTLSVCTVAFLTTTHYAAAKHRIQRTTNASQHIPDKESN